MDKSFSNIDKLDSTNYQTWKLMMEMVLLHQDLWNIIEGTWPMLAITDIESVN